jgi:hypothetical protein
MSEEFLEPADGSSDVVAQAAAPAYFALRVCPRAESAQWWISARLAASSAPPPVRAILAGRTRVEVSAEEAAAALRWARSVPGGIPTRSRRLDPPRRAGEGLS